MRTTPQVRDALAGLAGAPSAKAAHDLERQLLEQTDNRPHADEGPHADEANPELEPGG